MDWYPWYFLLHEADTMHLDVYQDGCYRRLLDHYMKTRSPLPDNNQALARIVGDSPDNWEAKASAIIRAFFQEENGLLFHKKCDEILDEQDKKTKKLSMSGKKGANKRWRKQKLNSTANDGANSQPMADAIAQDNTIQENKGKKTSSSRGLNDPDIREAFDIYNAMAERAGLPIAQKFTNTRKTRIKARLKDAGGLEGWKTAISKVESNSFLTGDGDRGWKANLDFLLKEQSFTQLMEGAYDENTKAKPGTSEYNRQQLQEWVDGK